MSGFPEQHHASLPDPIEQRLELDRLDVFEMFCGLPEEGDDGRVTASRPCDPCCRVPIRPPLRAYERHELYAAQLLLPILVLTDSRHAHEFLRPRRGAHRDHQPPTEDELRPERVGH